MAQPTFNEEILSLALDSRGKRASELADHMGVSRGLVSKWSNGVASPPGERVAEIADYLDYPVTLFYRGERVRNSDSVCFHHRKRKSMPTEVLNRIEAEMHLAQLQAKRLLAELEIEFALPFLTLDVEEYGSPSATAQALRSFWRVPHGPISNLAGLVEAAGAVVVFRSFGTPKLDGMSCWAKGTPPLFFLNSDLPADRLRWVLAHELGHLTMHSTPPQGDPEEEAEEFARELLLPADLVNADLKSLTFMRLPALKHEWRVPMKELITAASRRNLLPPNKVKSISVQYSRAGWHGGEPYEIDPDRPGTVAAALDVHLQEHGYTTDQLAAVIDLNEKEFISKFMGQHRPRLRLV